MWYKVAYWTIGNQTASTCIYTIRYYPDTHEVRLVGEGNNWEEHKAYNAVAVPAFYRAKQLVLFNDRDAILKLIEDEHKGEIKKVAESLSGPPVPSNEELFERSIEDLRRMIQVNLEKEDYLEVAKLQKELDKKLGNTEHK